MLTFRTMLFFVGWVAMTLIGGTIVLPAILSQRAIWVVNGWWTRLTLGWLRLTCGITSTRHGLPTTALIACKHQSAWDTLMLVCALGNPAFVLKRELYLIPIFGWFLWRSGQIAIDRSRGREAYAQIERQAKRIRAQGRPIIIFPEGTRVPVGQHKPYRSGIARISAMLKLDVTPVAVNAGLFWPKKSLLKKPGEAVIAFLDPMPACGDDIHGWMHQLETTIEQKTAELCDASRRSQP